LAATVAAQIGGPAKTHQTLSLHGKFFGRACKYVMTIRSSTEGSYLSPDTTRTKGYILFHTSMDRGEMFAMKDGTMQETRPIRKTLNCTWR